MKVVTLLENTTCRDDLACAHGLSLYIETAKNKILFDMGPDESFLKNAEALGVDISKVNIAFISHGHSDHVGGLEAFCRLNQQAKIYVRENAFGNYWSLADGNPHYIGIDQTLDRSRLILTGEETVVDEELTLFSAVPDSFGALAASAKLREKVGEEFLPDGFAHEQDLLITAEGKTLLLAGCAHRGIVNILHTAAERLGRRPDMTFGGFHLFQLTEGDPNADRLIDMTGKALLEGSTVYYTGHCTGEYAYDRLKEILGDRLQHMSGGVTVEI
jgi:7,8-dihydropterin-6-yl-methyl-4-(beta-D-ribofuranosyl)aminobenzene 5'-phosphate synthase